ncbi:MAG: WecB/TagA/CpsF family glycosyltransferase [Candidatus Muiribacteriaceae bacterium]
MLSVISTFALIMFLLSIFLRRVNILMPAFLIIAVMFIEYFSEIQSGGMTVPIIIGTVFFYFLGVIKTRSSIDISLEMIFQMIITAAVIFLGLKIYFIRNFSGGFYYFSETRAVLFTFFWIFLNINALRITSGIPELFLGVGLSLVVSSSAIIISQGASPAMIVYSLSVVFLYLWKAYFQIFLKEDMDMDRSFYLLSFLTVTISIIGTAKSVLLFGVLIPLTLLGVPMFFIVIMTAYSYVRFRRSGENTFSWNFSYTRMLLFLYLIIFFISIESILFFSKVRLIIILPVTSVLLVSMYLAGKKLFFVIPEKAVAEKRIFGVRIRPEGGRRLFRKVIDILTTKYQNYIVTLNALMLYEASEDEIYRIVLDSADVQIVDGVGVLWAYDFLGFGKAKKVAGVDFMLDLLRMCAKYKKKVYLLGSRDKVLKQCIERAETDFPGLDICGYHNGFFDEEEEHEVINDIRSESPDLLLVGMGVPKQEKWIFYNIHRLKKVRLAMGVGGAFDVYSGNLRRAPGWLQDLGLEWLYRFIREPWRLNRIIRLPVFVIEVIKEKLQIIPENQRK